MATSNFQVVATFEMTDQAAAEVLAAKIQTVFNGSLNDAKVRTARVWIDEQYEPQRTQTILK